MATGQILHRFTGHEGEITSLDFNRDGTLLASKSTDLSAALWSTESSGQLARFSGHEYSHGSIRFAPRGDLLITTEHTEWTGDLKPTRVRVWEITTQRLRYELDGFIDKPDMGFANNETILVTRSDGVRAWDLYSGQLLAAFQDREAALSPDGPLVATSSANTIQAQSLAADRGSLKDYSDWVAPLGLTDSQRREFFPETPSVLGY